jgi:hypothetical protein
MTRLEKEVTAYLFFDVPQQSLELLLKLTSNTRAGHDCSEVDRKYTFILERLKKV